MLSRILFCFPAPLSQLHCYRASARCYTPPPIELARADNLHQSTLEKKARNVTALFAALLLVKGAFSEIDLPKRVM